MVRLRIHPVLAVAERRNRHAARDITKCLPTLRTSFQNLIPPLVDISLVVFKDYLYHYILTMISIKIIIRIINFI